MMTMHKLLEINPENWAIESPLETSPDEVRAAIQFLKKKPDGIAVGADSNALFGESKAAMYETLGVTVRSGDRIRLTSLGWDMARQLEPTTESFRTIISHHKHYRAALDWAFRQCLPALTAKDVVDYWLHHSPEITAGDNEQVDNRAVECFFDLCQAAALGSVSAGDGRGSSSLRLDREELAGFLILKTFPRLVVASDEGTSMAQKDSDPQPFASDVGEKRAEPASETLKGQTIALKILSLAMIEELDGIGEGRDINDSRGIDFAGEVRRFETALIKSALRCAGGRQRRAARLLNMTKSTFNAKLKRYNIQS